MVSSERELHVAFCRMAFKTAKTVTFCVQSSVSTAAINNETFAKSTVLNHSLRYSKTRERETRHKAKEKKAIIPLQNHRRLYPNAHRFLIQFPGPAAVVRM